MHPPSPNKTPSMNVTEEAIKDLEAHAKRLEEEIATAVEYNKRLRSELEGLKRHEELTLTWLCACTRNAPFECQ
jgi:predicted RNase H-like nuclease (RuvC/YqgF family)